MARIFAKHHEVKYSKACKRSYNDTKKWARSIPVVSKSHWEFLVRQNLIPLDIPTNFNQVYDEFSSWSDLGNKIKGKAYLKKVF